MANMTPSTCRTPTGHCIPEGTSRQRLGTTPRNWSDARTSSGTPFQNTTNLFGSSNPEFVSAVLSLQDKVVTLESKLKDLQENRISSSSRSRATKLPPQLSVSFV